MKIRRQYVRFFLGLVGGLAFAVLVAVSALFAWVAAEPRLLNVLTPYIEEAFNSGDGSHRLKIKETWLIWDGWKHPVDLRLRGVSVVTREGDTFSTFPEIAVGVHLPYLLTGKIYPTSLVIDHPVISLFQGEDKSISFGLRPPEQAEAAQQEPTLPFAVAVALIAGDIEAGQLRKLRHIAIRNADVSVGSMAKGVFFKASNVDMVAKHKRGIMEFLASAKIRYDDYQSVINAHLKMEKGKPGIEGTVNFRGVEISALSDLFMQEKNVIPVQLPISGTSHVSLDGEGNLQRVRFKLEGGRGQISTDMLAAAIPISWMSAEGQVSNNGNDIQIDSLTGELDGMLLEGNGVILLASGDAAVKVDASLKNVPGEKVAVLWPAGLAPMTREWVTSNIHTEVIPEASVRTNIQMGDLQKPSLPKESVDANIVLKDATIRYLAEHPEVRHVNGNIHIDGIALDATIDSAAYMSNTKISDGRVLIEDLNADNPYIQLSFAVESPAKDAARFLALPRLMHAERLGFSADSIEGSAKGTASVGFNFFAPRDAQGNPLGELEVAYDLKADLSGVTQKGFMKKFDIENASGSLSLDMKGMEFAGAGRVNGVQVKRVEVRYLSVAEGGLDTFIKAEGTAGTDALARFGYPKLEFLAGTLGVKADVKLGAAQENAQASIDLTHAALDVEALSWKKPDKQPASLDIATEKKDGVTRITAFNLKSQDVEAKGAVDLNKELTGVSRVQLDKLVMGRTDLSKLDYAPSATGFALSVAGKSADLSGYFHSKGESENSFSFKEFPAVQVKVDIGRLYMANGREVTGFKGDLTCDTRICSGANMAGIVGEKPFHFRILRNPKSRRQLSVHAENAGEFLKAFDLYDKLEGGDLTITGNYEDTQAGSLLRARLDINEHNIKKAPILAKILSLASLTGFIDVLEGNGIRFTKMVIPFTLHNDVLTISKARAYGTAIGITAEGVIVFPKMTVDMKGTVVPAYAANSILGKLPIFGDILTGGKGEGVFAGSYTVKGNYDDAQVSVNPLSILTPGFLRGIFDGGDTKKSR